MDDEYHRSAKAEEKSYYGVAHTVHEPVSEQATIMVNGKLKEYQVYPMKSTCMLTVQNIFSENAVISRIKIQNGNFRFAD